MQKLPNQIAKKLKPAIYVDFDGTLATYEGWGRELGKPVPAMMRRVRRWLRQGKRVVIFSARVTKMDGTFDWGQQWNIRSWLCDNGLPVNLKITNVKGPDAIAFWDDRAVRVELNTGRRIR